MNRQVSWDGLRPLPLESEIVYGPLYSRRLDLSLGLNVLPTDYKACSFDCLYCHYGSTDLKSLHPPPNDFPSIHEVAAALEARLRRSPALKSVTFSGNGEPTLHPHFRYLVLEVARLRDRLCPDVKLALFSNATTALQPEIQAALRHIDIPILKLDAGDPETFLKVNRPAPEVAFQTVVEGLKATPNLIVQSVLINGPVSNVSDAAFEAWIETLLKVQPAAVQIYSTDYPVLSADVQRVPPYVLRRLAARAEERLGVPVRPFWVD
ncbi:MAG: radical SAM protein [Anaerolineae bacterium]